jgi:hypothetical protein
VHREVTYGVLGFNVVVWQDSIEYKLLERDDKSSRWAELPSAAGRLGSTSLKCCRHGLA